MGVNDTYQTVKTKAINLRKKIMDRIFDSRFDSMLDAIDKSSEISKIIGNRINMAGSTFNAFGKPLKICYPNIVSPSLISTNDKAITPKWNGNTYAVRVNSENLSLIPIPELHYSPAEIEEIISRISKIMNYGVYISEPYTESHAPYYDTHDYKFGYYLPDSISPGYYDRYVIYDGNIPAIIPVDIRALLPKKEGEELPTHAYWKCWTGTLHVLTISAGNVGIFGGDFYVDCNVALYDVSSNKYLGTVYAPLILNVWLINRTYLSNRAMIYITNLTGFGLASINIGDVFVFFGAYSPLINSVRIAKNASISLQMGDSCS